MEAIVLVIGKREFEIKRMRACSRDDRLVASGGVANTFVANSQAHAVMMNQG